MHRERPLQWRVGLFTEWKLCRPDADTDPGIGSASIPTTNGNPNAAPADGNPKSYYRINHGVCI